MSAIGVIGGALTLLSNLQSVFDLAKWADWLVLKWSALINPIIVNIVQLFGINLSMSAGSMIVMAIFVAITALGSRLEYFFNHEEYDLWPISLTNIFNKNVLIASIIYIVLTLSVLLIYLSPSMMVIFFKYPDAFIYLNLFLYCVAIIVGLRGWPYWARVLVAMCMIGFSYIFSSSIAVPDQPNVSEGISTLIAGLAAIICGLIVVAVAPPIVFTKRLITIVMISVGTIGLSELSRLGLSAVP